MGFEPTNITTGHLVVVLPDGTQRDYGDHSDPMRLVVKRYRFFTQLVLGPRPRGPKHGHKLTDEVMCFMRSALVEDPALHAPGLAERVRDRFGLTVHPRSIERALAKDAQNGLLA